MKKDRRSYFFSSAGATFFAALRFLVERASAFLTSSLETVLVLLMLADSARLQSGLVWVFVQSTVVWKRATNSPSASKRTGYGSMRSCCAISLKPSFAFFSSSQMVLTANGKVAAFLLISVKSARDAWSLR